MHYFINVIQLTSSIKAAYFSKKSYENFPNKTSFPAAGLAGILRARRRDRTAIPAPAKKTNEGE